MQFDLALYYVSKFIELAEADANLQLQRRDLASSEPFYPSPWADPNANGWEDAYAKAAAFVSQLTLMEKVNLTTGVG
jgi:beta-glucosidase